MKLEIHVHVHNDQGLILDRLALLQKNTYEMERKIMATLAEVQAGLDALQAASDSEHQQAVVVLQKVTDLEAEVAALKAQIDAGTAATPADLDGLLTRITAIKDGVSGIIPDSTIV